MLTVIIIRERDGSVASVHGSTEGAAAATLGSGLGPTLDGNPATASDIEAALSVAASVTIEFPDDDPVTLERHALLV